MHHRYKDGTFGRVKVWDTPGSLKRFKNQALGFLKNADCAILMFSLDDRDTFDSIRKWLAFLKPFQEPANTPFVLLGNKLDLEEEVDGREVSYMEAFEMGEAAGMEYFESSIVSGYGIKEAIDNICERAHSKLHGDTFHPVTSSDNPIWRSTSSQNNRISLYLSRKQSVNSQKEKSKCCSSN